MRPPPATAARVGWRPDWTLKLFVHHGSYVHSRIAARDELAGTDVILVHRLLKGAVAAEARTAGFALFTAAAVEALGLDPVALGLTAAGESIEHIGPVSTFVWDLETRWQAESSRRRVDTTAGAAVLDLEGTFPEEASVVWAYLTAPALRSQWEGPIAVEETSIAGRRGVGTISQCVTGRLATLEEIVDWQPYDHIGWRLAIPDVGSVLSSVDLDPVAGGTRVHIRWTVASPGPGATGDLAPVGHEKRAALDRLATVLAARDGAGADRLKRVVES